MLSYKLQSSKKQKLLEGEDENIAFCRKILVSVSRSFAAVIQALPESLILDICIFYLVLRALDTVEDDMEVAADRKRQLLTAFVDTALTDPNWTLTGIGAGDERLLLEEFPKVHAVYTSLPEESRTVIADITQRMADGMGEFVGADLLQGTRDVEQYNLYCHYVAGLVGEGLSRLFAASKFEDASLAQQLDLSNSMGLFLQKTNIIRDFLEDYVDQRAFWPKTVWKKYGSSLGDFTMEQESRPGGGVPERIVHGRPRAGSGLHRVHEPTAESGRLFVLRHSAGHGDCDALQVLQQSRRVYRCGQDSPWFVVSHDDALRRRCRLARHL